MPSDIAVDENKWRELAERALTVRENAYAPFSGFRVGAALLTADGRIFAGANVENSSYGLTICAEQSAACAAISSGASSFIAMVVASDSSAAPCGACRQFSYEFGKEMQFGLVDAQGKFGGKVALASLLPSGFRIEKEA